MICAITNLSISLLKGIPTGLVKRSEYISKSLSQTIHVEPIQMKNFNQRNDTGSAQIFDEILTKLMSFDFKTQEVNAFVHHCLEILE